MSRSLRSLFFGCLATGLLAASQGAHALPSACDTVAFNLVANCGFETGDFSGWTTTNADPNFTFTSVSNFAPHTGAYAASFGNSRDQIATISQTLITIPGAQYTVSFWLASEDAPESDPDNQFSFSWTGAPTFGAANLGPSPYTFYSFQLAATTASTTLSFSAFDTPSFLDFDDVLVVAAAAPPTTVPEPTSLALLALAGSAAVLQSRRRKTGGAV